VSYTARRQRENVLENLNFKKTGNRRFGNKFALPAKKYFF